MSAAVRADDLNAPLAAAQALLANGEHAAAYARFLRHAETGNALAAFSVGLFHQSGWGRPVDRAEACAWFGRAAKGDIPAAAHFFADCLLQGHGGDADPAGAAQWYGRAAALGHHGSLCALADLHMTGTGVARDPRRGLALCRQAAELGSVPAAGRTGRYLLEGDDSIRDAVAARAWFETAATGSPEAQFHLGRMHRDGLGVEISPQQARYWFESAASRGYVPAYFPTAQSYLQPFGDLTRVRPPAEILAKGYMWLRATELRSRTDEERAAATAWLTRVRAVMPETWRPTLEARVAAHLEEHPARY